MAAAYLTPSDSCDKILNEVRASNLHFLVQESPFSIYLTIRKKFTKNITQSSRTTEPTDLNIYSELENKKVELDEARDIIKILEDKVQHAEEECIKEANKFKGKREEMADEIKILKNNIKNSHAEESLHQNSLKEVRKTLKTKEKEIYNLEGRLDNSLETIKKLKENNVSMKKDLQKANKSIEQSNYKIEQLSKKPKKKAFSLSTQTDLEQFIPVKLHPKVSMDITNTSSTVFLNKPSIVTSSFDSLATQETFLNNNPDPSKSCTTKRVLETASTRSESNGSASEIASSLASSSVDQSNFEVKFSEFLRTFKEDPTAESSKYTSVAIQMMAKQYNMFHVFLKDISLFNPSLAEFIKVEQRKLNKELLKVAKDFIEDIKMGEPKFGVILSFIYSK